MDVEFGFVGLYWETTNGLFKTKKRAGMNIARLQS
jgi:hypothetical protein